MRTKFRGFLTLILAFAVQLTFAQEKTITGTVTDAESGMPLPGVNIIIEGTNTGTQTDFDGNYSIQASPGQVLVFTYVGYSTKNVTVGADTTINVGMAQGAELEKVVIVAYGESSTAKLASSVSTVQAEEIEDIPIASVDQALQGKVAGANVMVNSGQPGKSGSILIRGRSSLNGTSQPLYIVDGIPINEDRFRSLNNNDIKTITVLKDAAATAIYGNRAANGVIIITTKSGKYESPFTVNYSTLFGVSIRPEPGFQPMNAKQYLTFRRDFFTPPGNNFTDAEINAIAKQTNTDWTDILLRKGKTTSHQISITQGTEKVKYYTSLGYLEQEGITLGSKLERFSFRTNLDAKPNEKFDISTNLTLNYSINDFVVDAARESFIFGDNTGGELDNPFIVPYIGLPHYSPYNPDGTLNFIGTVQSGAIVNGEIDPNGANGFLNTPYLALNTAKFATDEEREFVGIGNIRGNYHLNDNFTLGALFGINYSNIEALNINPPNSLRGLIRPDIDSKFKGQQVESFIRFFTTNINPYLKYHKEWDKHTIDAGVFMEYLYTNVQSSGFQAFGLDPKLPGSGSGFTPGDLEEGPDNTNYYIPNVFSSEREEALYSYFGRVDYDYDTRYGLTFSIRRDGSSRFLEDNRYGLFYAVGGRWNIDNEAFFNSKTISSLKLRASYGEVGNKGVGVLRADRGFYVGQPTIVSITGYQGNTGYVPLNLIDPDLEWENTVQINLGLDFGLWGDDLTGTVNLYDETTKDLFYQQTVSLTTGFSNVFSNVASVSNKGIELELSYTIVDNPEQELRINIFGNGAYNQNEIEDLGGLQFDPSGNNAPGHPIREFYRVRWAGVNPANGEPLWYDKEGNLTDVYNSDDAVFLGKSADPSFFGGFGANIEYKGFDLNTLFSFAADQYRLNQSLSILEDPSISNFANQSVTMLNAWQQPGDITAIPGIDSDYSRIGNQGDRYLEDASFIKFRNVTLGYTFDEDMLANTNFLKSLRIYLQGTNLVTWSKWRGFDPESTFSSSFFEYPSPRQFSVGLDATF